MSDFVFCPPSPSFIQTGVSVWEWHCGDLIGKYFVTKHQHGFTVRWCRPHRESETLGENIEEWHDATLLAIGHRDEILTEALIKVSLEEYDVSTCMSCDRDIICIPDGMPCCEKCAQFMADEQ